MSVLLFTLLHLEATQNCLTVIKNIKQIGSDLSIAVNLVELGKRADHRWIVTMIYGVSSLFVAKYTALVLGCTDGRTDGTDG